MEDFNKIPYVGSRSWEFLQISQFKHDELFHREISRLSVKDRLSHMALHYAKYSGYLFLREKEAEDIFVDILIISISTMNILNKKIEDNSIPYEISATNIKEYGLFECVVISSSRMASACERIDHLEVWDFNKEITEAVKSLISISVLFFENKNVDFFSKIEKRLSKVREKSIFFNFLNKKYEDM